MSTYVINRVFYDNRIKWIIALVIVSSLTYYCTSTRGINLSIQESLLATIDSRLMMLTFFTLIPIFINCNYVQFKTSDTQIVTRFNKKCRWLSSNVASILISSIALIVIIFAIYITIGKMNGLHNLQHWEKSVFYNNTYLHPDSFDSLGNPFILMINGDSDIHVLYFEAIILLSLRSIFFSLVLYSVTSVTKKFIVGFVVTCVIAVLEIYINTIIGANSLSVFPHEYTLLTAIDGIAIPFQLSVIYWLIIITLLLFVASYYNNNLIEYYLLNEQKAEKDY